MGTRTGVINEGGDYALTGWPWGAVAAAVLLGLCGVWLVLVAQRVRRQDSQRYDRAAVTGAGAQGGNGEAPATATSGTPAPGDVGTPTTVGQAQAAEHADDIDTWDALTRGEDPTGD